MSLFTDSSGVTIVSDGLLRPSRESFAEALTALYSSVRDLEIIKDEARITVLGPDAAVLTAVYRYSRADTAGRTSEGLSCADLRVRSSRRKVADHPLSLFHSTRCCLARPFADTPSNRQPVPRK